MHLNESWSVVEDDDDNDADDHKHPIQEDDTFL